MDIRKTQIIKEVIHKDQTGKPCKAITRVVAMAVIKNPFAGKYVEDLSQLFDIGGKLGEQLFGEAAKLLGGPGVSYGKATIMGTMGDIEQGGAITHPKMGKPMRAALGGGTALIPSNVKIGGPGTAIDIPIGHKDDGWSFDHFDTITVMIPDAPLPDEIVVCMVATDGSRPHPRVGKGPITT